MYKRQAEIFGGVVSAGCPHEAWKKSNFAVLDAAALTPKANTPTLALLTAALTKPVPISVQALPSEEANPR